MANFHTKSLLHSLVHVTILHCAVHSKSRMHRTRRHTIRSAWRTEPHPIPLRRAVPMCKFQILTAVLIAAALAGCDKKPPAAAQVRPVRIVTVERGADGETLSLTGQVRAKDQVSLAFRLEGRMIKRLVNVGDALQAGEIVAQLDPQNQQNGLRTAQANLASAEAAL